MDRHLMSLLAGALLLGRATAGHAVLITVDENGGGDLINCFGGGGLGLECLLPPAQFQSNSGDVVLKDGEATADVIRFGGNSVGFFSDDDGDSTVALADVAVLPTNLFNVVVLPEAGTETDNGAFYTPLPGQPGFVNGQDVTYKFISDGTGPPAVPEPASLLLLGSGLAGLGVFLRKRTT